MWSTTQRFLDTIPKHQQRVTTVTATPYNGTSTSLKLVAGTVTADRSQRIRRVTNLTVEGGSALYDLLSTPGCRIAVDHGFAYGRGEQELIPQIRGELSAASLVLGDGVIGVTCADLWQRLAGSDYITPYTPSLTARRVDVLLNAVTDAIPGITTSDYATDQGKVGTAQAWTSRADMIYALATDSGAEAFFAPDGRFIVRDIPTLTGPAAWTIKTGIGGTLDTLTRQRPLDRLYNTVILTPATLDPSQAWSQVVAQITDTNDLRHPSRIGVRPYRYQSPTLLTEADAIRVAGQLLQRLRGTTESLSLSALANCALEPGDIVRTLAPLDGGYDLDNHFLEQSVVDLATGAMTAATRSGTDLT